MDGQSLTGVMFLLQHMRLDRPILLCWVLAAFSNSYKAEGLGVTGLECAMQILIVII